MLKARLLEAFGRELRHRRLMAGMTLDQLAERSGMTPNYLGTVECGKRDISLTTIDALAEAFGIAPGVLLGTSHEMSPAAEEGGRLLARLPHDMQASFIKIMRALVRLLPR
jgi:transcriptional regulator with XRE-family HTH domain